jgi:uncharacterized protein (DUF488 family)
VIQWYQECYDPTYMVEMFTIGYEGLAPAEFTTILAEAGVEHIVDVRELAISRRRGFAKSALTTSLSRAGIAYTHLSALGCPRDIRHAYREDRDWKRYTKRFCAYLDRCHSALEELLELVTRERCCLLCYEADANFCHRLFIAERLQSFAPGIRVNHLISPARDRVVVPPRELAAA